MSSPTSAVSGSSKVGATISSATKQPDEKARVTMGVALSALTEPMVRTLNVGSDLEASPARKTAAIQNVMSLKPVKSRKTHTPLPNFNLKLTPQEMSLLNSMFDRWALTQSLTLLDVWGVDLFAHFELLLPYFPDVSKLIEAFTGKFILGYVGFLHGAAAEARLYDAQEIPLYERGRPAPRYVLMMTQAEWAYCLQDLRTQIINLEKQPKAKIKTIRAHLQNIKNRLDLGYKFLNQPNAALFLCDSPLSKLESHFPKSQALNALCSAEKSVKDLATYIRFIDTGCYAGCDTGILSIKHPFFAQFVKHLLTFPKSDDTLSLIQDAKTGLAMLFKKMDEQQSDVFACYMQARAKKLTHAQFCQNHGIQVALPKSQDDFITSLYFKNLQMQFLSMIAHDCIDIFDERIVHTLHPQKFVPTYIGFRRLALNLDYFVNQQYLQAPALELPPPPTDAPHLKSLIAEMQKDLSLWKEAVDPERLIQLGELFSILIAEERIFYHHWIPLAQLAQPLVKQVEKFIPTLDTIRAKYLQRIEAFLSKLNVDDLRANRAAWASYFKEVGFRLCLDFCRVSMLSNDLDALSRFTTDMNVLCSEEHLISPPVGDLMEMEGVDELIDGLVRPKISREIPMTEDLEDKPVKTQTKVETVVQTVLAPVEKVETKKNAQLANAVEQPAAPLFSIRRGEKMRRLLDRLEAMGFVLRRTKGSHQIYVQTRDDGKQTTVVVPKRKHQKQGTARGIASQVNGMG